MQRLNGSTIDFADIIDACNDDEGRVTGADVREAIQLLAGEHEYCEQCGDCVTCLVCACPPVVDVEPSELRLRNPLNATMQSQWIF